MMRTLRTGSLVVVLTLALAFAAIVITASPGGAAGSAQVCARMTGSGTFAPGLMSKPKNNTLKLKGNQAACTPPASTGGGGAFTATVAVTQGTCVKLGVGNQRFTATGTTAWRSGQSSKYSLTLSTGSGNAATVATITGHVTSGLFAGHSVAGAIKFTVPGKPNCTSKPLKQITYTSAKTFVIS